MVVGRVSPYRLEINPWLLDSDLEKTLLARGAFVSAVGEIETRLTEISIRLSRLPHYRELRQSFPSRRKDRIAFLRSAAQSDGPLSDHGPALLKFVVRYEQFCLLRDILAHGSTKALSLNEGGATVKLYDFFADGDNIMHRRENCTSFDLERKARRVSRCARALNYLLSQVDAQRLPPLEGAP